MSPACAERQNWLVTMLDDMADGVVGLIEAKIKHYRMCERYAFKLQNSSSVTEQ